jgi:predicted GIY-YIG superfamily endonuclease
MDWGLLEKRQETLRLVDLCVANGAHSLLEGASAMSELVYLIHFEWAYRHARHYLGTTTNLEQRLQQHRRGRAYGGARLMEVVMEAGIPWRVVRTWEGGRELELQLKAWNNGGRLCPVCKAAQRKGAQ